MAKKGRSQKKDGSSRSSKRKTRGEYVDPQDMDDDIDSFHKQRDIIPLDVDGDVGELSDDEEEPIFDDEAINNDEDDDEDDDEDEDTGLAAKIIKQQKFLRAKFGDFDDELQDEEEDEEAAQNIVWSGNRSHDYHGGDNRDIELDSSDEALKEEEDEVLKLQRERAKNLSVEDFGLKDDEDESDKELTLGEISNQGKTAKKARLSKDAIDDLGTTFELNKDFNELSRKEQMEIISSSAPELVGLLSELNSTLEELENKVNPLLKKAKVGGIVLESGLRYLEVKQLLLLSYCQTITFYLLLKSEGQPVLDHPVIARLVEIRGLLDKMKQLDENLPSELDEFLKKNPGMQTIESLDREVCHGDHELSLLSADEQEPAELSDAIELLKTESLIGSNSKEGKHKRKNDEVGVQSMEMLKVRAALEEKLKQKGAFSSFSSKPDKAQKHRRPVNGRLESHEDYDDDAVDDEKGNHRLSNGHTSLLGSKKLSKLVISKQNKPKVVSGDDDLPMRDDIGERRRKHELRVLADAGVKTEDDAGIRTEDDAGIMSEDELAIESDKNDDMDEDAESSEDDLYEQVKQKRAAKLAAKAEIYTRTSAPHPCLKLLMENIEKNRGLTRPRNKLTKNPRKKYRTKHDKAQKRRLGQVRQIKKPSGPYGVGL
ncbi:something about silencing protein 10-like [Populus alba x Populus x berolinensis]|nr:something about silencing protein 10-like [Populus alba x Populus x berolinensis]